MKKFVLTALLFVILFFSKNTGAGVVLAQDATDALAQGCPANDIKTAIGCVPLTSTAALTNFALRWGIGIAGGIAFLMIIYAGFLIMTSAGDPKRLQGGQELMTSAVAGMILLIFSIFVLRLIGVNILGLF